MVSHDTSNERGSWKIEAGILTIVNLTNEIVLRPLGADEDEFWREIFYDSVRSHFEPLNLADDQLNSLLDMQYRAQNLDYRTNYPNASNYVIEYKGVHAGRVIMSTEHGDLRIIDLTVFTRFRGRGIGTRIFEWFFDMSREKDMPIRFHVEKTNPAVALYLRAGFKVVEDVTSHYQMEWYAEDTVGRPFE